jgi:hypothetical protein
MSQGCCNQSIRRTSIFAFFVRPSLLIHSPTPYSADKASINAHTGSGCVAGARLWSNSSNEYSLDGRRLLRKTRHQTSWDGVEVLTIQPVNVRPPACKRRPTRLVKSMFLKHNHSFRVCGLPLILLYQTACWISSHRQPSLSCATLFSYKPTFYFRPSLLPTYFTALLCL